jgi:hypothetical protein
MDIIERYICAYIVECITGKSGSNPNYYAVLETTRSNTKHPLLKEVLAIVHHKDAQSDEIKTKVRDLVLSKLVPA